MPLTNEKHRTDLRMELAQRIRKLRREKSIWSPCAPRGDLRCRRPMEMLVLDRVHGSASIADLVDAARKNGRDTINLEKVAVHLEVQDVPWEDFTIEVAVLTIEAKTSDEDYAGHIGGIWVEYQRALQARTGRSEQFDQYLALKAQFEPA